MFLIAKLHPHIDDTEKEDYNGLWLSRAAKEETIRRFYAKKQEIPLCIDHRDTGRTGFVKDANRVGRVHDLFLNDKSELMVKCELFNHHKDGYREVNQGMFRKGERWGVSVGLVNVKDPVTGKKKPSASECGSARVPPGPGRCPPAGPRDCSILKVLQRDLLRRVCRQ